MSDAMRRFGGFLVAWQTCQQTIGECSRLLGQDLTAVQCDGRAVREYVAGLADQLRAMREAFEARDTVLLADLLQYEMPDTYQTWQRVLTHLAMVVGSGVGNTPAQPS
jgi:hypothetical protein